MPFIHAKTLQEEVYYNTLLQLLFMGPFMDRVQLPQSCRATKKVQFTFNH